MPDHPALSTQIVDLAKLDPCSKEIRNVRGKDISMIFQELMTSLSPIHTIGDQITEAMMLHVPLSKQEARKRAIKLLRRVGIFKPGAAHVAGFGWSIVLGTVYQHEMPNLPGCRKPGRFAYWWRIPECHVKPKA